MPSQRHSAARILLHVRISWYCFSFHPLSVRFSYGMFICSHERADKWIRIIPVIRTLYSYVMSEPTSFKMRNEIGKHTLAHAWLRHALCSDMSKCSAGQQSSRNAECSHRRTPMHGIWIWIAIRSEINSCVVSHPLVVPVRMMAAVGHQRPAALRGRPKWISNIVLAQSKLHIGMTQQPASIRLAYSTQFER